jgi:hypothetical protein
MMIKMADYQLSVALVDWERHHRAGHECLPSSVKFN